MMSAQARVSRWNLRVAQDDDFVVRKAADESDRELSEFARSAAVVEAERILADRTTFPEAAEELGIRVMLVHAKREQASRWYKRFGFEESPTDPLHLVLLMKDLRAFLSTT